MRYPPSGFQRPPVRQRAGTAAGTQNPFITLFPELSDMPAPAWLKEGMRVTYKVTSASVAQKPGLNGSGGEGYSQYDLVAMENNTAVSSMVLFTNLNGAIQPSLVMRTVNVPGAGDYWINPAVLKNAERAAGNGMQVSKTPYKMGNKTYDATRFQYETQDASYGWVFDNASGVMLFYTSAIGNDNSDYKQLVQITLVQRRQLRLPWRVNPKSTVPGWATQGAQLSYTGTYGLALPDSTVPSLGVNVVAKITGSNPRWTDVEVQSTVQDQPNSAEQRATGVVQPFDGYWLPAEALRGLRDGQVIDRDTVTGATITAARDQATIRLTETGLSFTTVLTYNAQNGMLVGFDQQAQNGAGTVHIQLKLTGQP
jgi:hypothetical protein